MGIDVNKFEAAKNKARQMIHKDAQADSHIIKERMADRNNPKFYGDQPSDAYSMVTSFNNTSSSQQMINEDYTDNSEDRLGAAMDNRMQQFMAKRQQQPMPTMQTTSSMPKEIIESFSKNYIDQTAFNPNKSVLDTLGMTGDTLQPLVENEQTQRNVNSSGGKVDYEIIKGIVEGAVKKYVTALGKKMLTENKSSINLDEINAIQITDKKIAIVTKEGNLFEGKLKFVKNIKG